MKRLNKKERKKIIERLEGTKKPRHFPLLDSDGIIRKTFQFQFKDQEATLDEALQIFHNINNLR